MIVTVELPQEIFTQAQDVATARKTTLQALVVEGLRTVLRASAPASTSEQALARLRGGYHLGGGKPSTVMKPMHAEVEGGEILTADGTLMGEV